MSSAPISSAPTLHPTAPPTSATPVSAAPISAAPVSVAPTDYVIDIPCIDVPAGLVRCGILDVDQQCMTGGHCYRFPTIPVQTLCVPEIGAGAYEVCDSDCDCLGVNSIDYHGGAEYKYFVTNGYGNVYLQYFEKCSDCAPSTGGQFCVPSSYTFVGVHQTSSAYYGGCYIDETLDDYEVGCLYAYKFLK